MIEIRIVLAAVVAAVCLVLVVTITAGAQTAGEESSTSEPGSTRPSQGTVTEASRAELDSVRRDLAEEARLPDYTRVVDDTSDRRFDAPGWNEDSTCGSAASSTGMPFARTTLSM